jgi:uncharacterized protein (DUF2267 family)
MLDGNLRIGLKAEADLILKGSLTEYLRDVLRYTSGDDPQEYRLSLVVNISLWDRKEDKLLWQEDRFIADTTYFVTGSNAKTESSAIDDVVKDLARRIVERTVEEW